MNSESEIIIHESVGDLFNTKKILFVCLTCKKYIHGNSNDCYDHVCNSDEKNSIKDCMQITINALFYHEPANFTDSSIRLPDSPSLRSSMMDLSSILNDPERENSSTLRQFLTSTPKEINYKKELESFDRLVAYENEFCRSILNIYYLFSF